MASMAERWVPRIAQHRLFGPTHSPGPRTVHVSRPSPALVGEIGRRLSETVDRVSQPALVAAIRSETGCSRATAYRAVQDFVEQLEPSH